MRGYYDQLDDHADPTRQAGWRHRLAQAARFEAAIAGLGLDESLLDLGCGPGALAGYVSAKGHRGSYRGVDGRSAVLPVGDARFIRGDLFDATLHGADVVVAIGTLVNGSPFRTPAERRARAMRLARRGLHLARRRFVMVVLKQELLEARPGLGADPALAGVTAREASAMAVVLGVDSIVYDDVLTTDRCVVFSKTPTNEEATITCFAERAAGGPWGRDAEPAALARLWLQAGRRDRAEAWLARCTVRDAQWRWIRDATALL